MTSKRDASHTEPKRAEICRTAARVFSDRGYDGTSANEVARALNMTKAGLYHYFTGKEALLYEILSSRAGSGPYIDAYGVALLHDALGHRGRALSELERAVNENSAGLFSLDVDPKADGLRPRNVLKNPILWAYSPLDEF